MPCGLGTPCRVLVEYFFVCFTVWGTTVRDGVSLDGGNVSTVGGLTDGRFSRAVWGYVAPVT